jgi:hypothetical protein
MCNLSITELQGLGFFFFPFRAGSVLLVLTLKFLDCGNFPLKTGFRSIWIPLEKGFTLL